MWKVRLVSSDQRDKSPVFSGISVGAVTVSANAVTAPSLAVFVLADSAGSPAKPGVPEKMMARARKAAAMQCRLQPVPEYCHEFFICVVSRIR